ncbi:deoxyhypusine synthase [Candidatus Woesearchaeota archaeon]|nr:deoxyhypusine synthase [Candidatus Woesearchaeota archaeon]
MKTTPKDTGKENVLRDADSPDPKGLPEVHGYDFNKGVNYDKLLESYLTTGFQATHLAKAIELIKQMRKDKCTIYLGYTSNMVSSGLRDIFRFLVEHKMVDVLVTTAGGIEEDIIKCIKPFFIGDFTLDGKTLREQGINRAGNVLIPNSRYCAFEDFFIPLIKTMAEEQRKTGKVFSPSDLILRLGKTINNKDSIYYWAYKNNIPVFCPALTDGSMGDMFYFYSYENPDFKIDDIQDIRKLHDITIQAKKTGLIILGGGVVKHHILNSNMMRNGADYAVYINTAQEFDGSDAGARPDEAVSWGKILPGAQSIKVFGDATILFPLIVAKTFAQEVKK